MMMVTGFSGNLLAPRAVPVPKAKQITIMNNTDNLPSFFIFFLHGVAGSPADIYRRLPDS